MNHHYGWGHILCWAVWSWRLSSLEQQHAIASFSTTFKVFMIPRVFLCGLIGFAFFLFTLSLAPSSNYGGHWPGNALCRKRNTCRQPALSYVVKEGTKGWLKLTRLKIGSGLHVGWRPSRCHGCPKEKEKGKGTYGRPNDVKRERK